MSRYVWPRKRKSLDRPLERLGWNSLTDGVVTERAVLRAREVRREVRARRAADRAPLGQDDLWVPVGPSLALKGQGHGRPRVAGRVRDLAVSPNGKRAYAATANGGVWFTPDFGTTWHPVSNWLPTPGEPSTRVARTALACGCLHVLFGVGDDQDRDEVFVGTGELRPWQQGTPGLRNGGVGVLRLKTPITAAIGDPFGDHWAREAPNLAGFGIFRLARDPADPEVIVAATSAGVYSRTAPFVVDADWDPVASGPLAFDADDGITASDVLWIPSSPSRLVVALYGKRTGVYYSEGGITGDFKEIPLSGLKKGRIALAYSEGETDRMYVLAKGPLLYRVTFSDSDPPTALRVVDVPESLFGEKKNDSSGYNIAVAVDPNESRMVFIGGSTVSDGGHWTASLFRSFIMVNGDLDLDFTFAAANKDDPAADDYLCWQGCARGRAQDLPRAGRVPICTVGWRATAECFDPPRPGSRGAMCRATRVWPSWREGSWRRTRQTITS